jgi:hypothetical protein
LFIFPDLFSIVFFNDNNLKNQLLYILFYLDMHAFAKGTKEFDELEKCGFKMTWINEKGEEVAVDIRRMIGIFTPDQLFLRKISREALKEKYCKPVGTSDNAEQILNDSEHKEDKEVQADECPLCCDELTDATIMERWPCKVDYDKAQCLILPSKSGLNVEELSSINI